MQIIFYKTGLKLLVILCLVVICHLDWLYELPWWGPFFLRFSTCKISSLWSRIGCSGPRLLPFFSSESRRGLQRPTQYRLSFHFTFQVQPFPFLRISFKLTTKVCTCRRLLFTANTIFPFLQNSFLSKIKRKKLGLCRHKASPPRAWKVKMSGDVPPLCHVPS